MGVSVPGSGSQEMGTVGCGARRREGKGSVRAFLENSTMGASEAGMGNVARGIGARRTAERAEMIYSDAGCLTCLCLEMNGEYMVTNPSNR